MKIFFDFKSHRDLHARLFQSAFHIGWTVVNSPNEAEILVADNLTALEQPLGFAKVLRVLVGEESTAQEKGWSHLSPQNAQSSVKILDSWAKQFSVLQGS